MVKRSVWGRSWGRHGYLAFLVICLGLALLACIPGGDEPGAGDADQEATLAALRGEIEAGATADAPTDTPVPVDGAEVAPTVDPNAGVAAAQETATAVSVGATATADARNAAAGVEAANAQATLDPVLAELGRYGVDPAGGRLAWVHDPVVIDASGYMTYEYDIDFITPAQDFVMVADITWNTQFGSTGCGFTVRSDVDSKAGSRHLIIATRFANGEVGFFNQVDGNFIRDDIQRLDANIIDPLFEWQNDTTNQMAVVARGNVFSVYTNGTYLGDFIPEVGGLDRGFVAFVALNESGFTHCEFENGWLWLIE